MEIVLLGLKGSLTITELCHKKKISQGTYRNWRRIFLVGGLEALQQIGERKTLEQVLGDKKNKQIVDGLVIELELLKRERKLESRLDLPPSYWEGLFQTIDENDLDPIAVRKALGLYPKPFNKKRRQFDTGGVLPNKPAPGSPITYRAEDYESMIREIMQELPPGTGYKRIWRAMRKRGATLSYGPVFRIMKELGLLPPRRTGSSRKHHRSIDVNLPNEVWVADTTIWKIGRNRYDIYVCLDAYSRWIPYIMVSTDRTSKSTIRYYDQLFQKAQPSAIHTDLGTEFVNRRALIYLAKREIQWEPGPSYTPKSQGLVERVNQTLKAEWLTWKDATDAIELQRCVDDFREWYNKEREHTAIDYKVPEELYYAEDGDAERDRAAPKLRTLTKDDHKSINAKLKKARQRPLRSKRTRRRYRRYLEPFVNGAYVEVFLRKGEVRQTEKNRLKRAAEELRLTLVFKRTKGRMLFEVKPTS